MTSISITDLVLGWFDIPDQRQLSNLIKSQCLLNPSEHLFIELFKTEPYEKNTISEERVYVMSTQRESNETQVWAEALTWMTMTRQALAERITSCQMQKTADVAFRQERRHLGTVPNGGLVQNMPVTVVVIMPLSCRGFFTH